MGDTGTCTCPRTSIMYIRFVPSRFDVNAIIRPSRDQAGAWLVPWSVRTLKSVPSILMVHIWNRPPIRDVNAKRSPLGDQSGSVL